MRLFSAILLAAALVTPAAAETVLIRDGRVVTNTAAGTIENGDVLIVDGRIRAVGADIAAPRGARIVEAQGRYVTPGAFAAMSEIGLSEISGSGAPNDASVEGSLVGAAADAGRAFNPGVTAVAVTRMEGVTRAAIAPDTSSLFGGRGALVSLGGTADSVFRQNAFMVVELGETGANRSGSSRAALWPVFEAALRDAREYPARYRSGQGGAVLNELDAAALQPFARGQGLFLVHVESAADIRRLIRFKSANPGLRFAIHGGAEAWQVADELARARIPVILDPLSNLPDRFERLSARIDNAVLLHNAGVQIAIAPMPGTVDAHQARLVLQLAGNAVANGLPWDAAFAAVSRGPADIFGAGAQLGRLERNYLADAVIWDGDPLEVMSAPTAVYIEGVEQPLVSRQTRLRDRYHPRNSSTN
jgi:imidazolonepropionase-like amidohydrolase